MLLRDGVLIEFSDLDDLEEYTHQRRNLSATIG
jgi:hypothetical protein